MGLQYIAGGIDQLNVGSDTKNLNQAGTYTSTGSRFADESQTIATGAWQLVNTGSVGNMHILRFRNSGSGNIEVSSTTSSLGRIAYLWPNEAAVKTTWSGSTNIYAQAYTSASALIYTIVEQ